MAIGKLIKFLEDAKSFRIHPQTLSKLKDVEGGTEAVSRLQKEFDLTALKTGEFFAQPKTTEKAISEVENELGHLTEVADTTDNYAGKILNGEVPGGDSPVSHMLNTAATVSGVTIPQSMLTQWKKLHDTAGIINTKLMPTSFELLPSTTNWDGAMVKGGVWHVISNPKQAFGELSKDLVVKPTNLKFTADKYGKHARGIWKNLTKGMSNDDITSLNGVLSAGNDSEEVFTPVFNGLKSASGDIFEVSNQVREAYYGTRMLMDHMYWLNNTAAVRQANERGFKLLSTTFEGVKNSKVVKSVKGRHGEVYSQFKTFSEDTPKYIKWGADHEKEGWEVVEFMGKDGKPMRVALDPSQGKSFLKNIDEGIDMIGYRKGYVPVLYKDQWAVNKLTRMSDGTFSAARVSTAATRVKANKAVKRMTESNVLGEGEADVTFISSRKNDISTDVAYGENLHSVLNNLSPSEIKAMKNALVNMGISPEIADSLEQTGKFFSHKRNPFMMKRGMRLKDWTGEAQAEILPADVAVQKYLNASSSYSASADYVGKLEQKYLGEFGDLLTDPTDYLSPFKKFNSTLSNTGRSLLEAKLVRGQIQRVAGQASDADRIMENYIVSTLDHFATTKLGKKFDTFLDKLSDTWLLGRLVGTPSVATGLAKVKGFTATAKLGLWNVSQAIVQGTAALNVLGKNPIMAAKATRQVMQAVAPEIMKVGKTAEGRKLFNLIDDSGFIAGFDYVELQRVSSKGTDKLLGSRAMRKLWDTNLWPYQLGEGGVRALAWFTEYNILSKQIAEGVLKGVAQDSPKMLELINESASVTALNMSRLNQPLISRGVLGVPFQFKQFLIQQAEFLFGKNFRNGRERFGVWAAWVGAFGIQGMPWMFDLGIINDTAFAAGADALEALGIDTASPKYVGITRKTAQEISDHMAVQLADNKFARLITDSVGKTRFEDARAFWDRMAQSGAISALSDGELNIASRASLARVFTEYYGNQTLDDQLFGPGYQTAVMLIHNNITSFADLVNVWRNGDEFTSQYLLQTAARGARGLPGIQHPLQAAEQLLSGQWRDTEMRLIKDEPSLTQTLLIGAGFSPDKRSERFERIEFTQKQKKAWKKWLRNRQERIAKLSQEGHTEYATTLLDDSLSQIEKVNPILAGEFMMSYSQEMLRRNMTEDEKEFMYRHQDSEFYDSSYDKFFFGRDTYIGWGGEDDR